MDDDLLDEELELQTLDEPSFEEPVSESFNQNEFESNSDSDLIIDGLLSRMGIKDKTLIKYEENNEVVTKNWNDFDLQTLIEMLSLHEEPLTNNELSAEELDFIKEVRNNRMTPREYAEYLKNLSLKLVQQEYVSQYEVDNIEDDVLFVTDILEKIGEENITDLELNEMLENAKANPTLYQKQIQVIRQDYKNREDSERINQLEYNNSLQIARYNQFAESVEDSIRKFTDIAGMGIDMSEDEMEQLYDFIVSFDNAGISTFSKALNHPDTLVKMAWFAINGEQAIQDLNDSFMDELKKAEERGYKKALEEGKTSKASKLYINKNGQSDSDALDRY